jgi:hypothetical protein
MKNGATDADARAALEAIERSRRQVIEEIDMPRWYWWGLAIGWVGLGVLTDLRNPWVTGVATLAFGAIHSSVAQRVWSGRHRTNQLSVRAEVAGRHVPRFVIAGLISLAALTIAGALAASADGARHPVTIASIVVAIIIVLGGPRLMAAVRGRVGQTSSVS